MLEFIRMFWTTCTEYIKVDSLMLRLITLCWSLIIIINTEPPSPCTDVVLMTAEAGYTGYIKQLLLGWKRYPTVYMD